MTDLEMRVEALIRCVDQAAFGRALQEVSRREQIRTRPRSEEEVKTEIQKTIHDLLSEIGMPSHIRGYRYAASAIQILIEHPGYLGAMTRMLYPTVAQRYKATPERVSRGIRNGVECAWDRGNLDLLDRYWGNSVKRHMGRPTNSEFLAKCAELVRDRLGLSPGSF